MKSDTEWRAPGHERSSTERCHSHSIVVRAGGLGSPQRSWGGELKQPDDLPVRVQVDAVGGGDLGQAGHGHDVAAHGDDELGAGR